jgi:hypothetical protein
VNLLTRIALAALRPLEAWHNWTTRRYIKKHHGDPRACLTTRPKAGRPEVSTVSLDLVIDTSKWDAAITQAKGETDGQG